MRTRVIFILGMAARARGGRAAVPASAVVVRKLRRFMRTAYRLAGSRSYALDRGADWIAEKRTMRRFRGESLPSHPAAIDGQDGAVDVVGGGGGEEDEGS